MDSMDNLHARMEALEQQMSAMGAHTRTVARRLSWWRGFACGVMLLGRGSLLLQSGTAEDKHPVGMDERKAAVEKLSAMACDDTANAVVITEANLRIVNGLGRTDTTNGLGNLIVGYNELRGDGFTDTRTGSHNVVVGSQHNFSSFGGQVIGSFNEISGRYASVSGRTGNTASGPFSSVSGGEQNTASGFFSSVSGGEQNTASGQSSSVSGGNNRSAPALDNWAAGALFSDH